MLPKGEFLPLPLLCSVTFGTPMLLDDGEAHEAFLERARGALLALGGKSLTETPATQPEAGHAH